jgi:hypothetical protein
MASANPPLEERYFVLFVVSLGVIATGQYSILQQDRQPRQLATRRLRHKSIAALFHSKDEPAA